MSKRYGTDNIDAILREWSFVLINDSLNNAAANVSVKEKKININQYNWSIYGLHRILSATIHEIGHALKELSSIQTGSFLNDGRYSNDDFFGDIYLDIVVPKIIFSRNITMGDSAIDNPPRVSEQLLCQVSADGSIHRNK